MQCDVSSISLLQQAEFALDMEIVMPTFIHKKLRTSIPKGCITKQDQDLGCWRKVKGIQAAVEGQLTSSEVICEKIEDLVNKINS